MPRGYAINTATRNQTTAVTDEIVVHLHVLTTNYLPYLLHMKLNEFQSLCRCLFPNEASFIQYTVLYPKRVNLL
jgi:hypothetical protein